MVSIIGAPVIDMDSKDNADKFLIMDMGAKGALEFKKRYRNAIFIYIIPPTCERLMLQMESRSASRLQRSKRQISQANEVCDWLVVNDDLDTAVNQIERIMHIIKEYGDRLDDIDIETMRFLYSRNFHNKDNIDFINNFYPDEITHPDGPSI